MIGPRELPPVDPWDPCEGEPISPSTPVPGDRPALPQLKELTRAEAGVPTEVRDELLTAATANGRISYHWLLELYKRGVRAGQEAAFVLAKPTVLPDARLSLTDFYAVTQLLEAYTDPFVTDLQIKLSRLCEWHHGQDNQIEEAVMPQLERVRAQLRSSASTPARDLGYERRVRAEAEVTRLTTALQESERWGDRWYELADKHYTEAETLKAAHAALQQEKDTLHRAVSQWPSSGGEFLLRAEQAEAARRALQAERDDWHTKHDIACAQWRDQLTRLEAVEAALLVSQQAQATLQAQIQDLVERWEARRRQMYQRLLPNLEACDAIDLCVDELAALVAPAPTDGSTK